MRNLIEAQIYLEDKINRLRAIHYITNKLTTEKLTNEDLEKVIGYIHEYAENNIQLEHFKRILAMICPDTITITALRKIAFEDGMSKAYKLTKPEIISRLKRKQS